MNTRIKKALVLTVAWLGIVWIIMPSLANRYLGQCSLLRFDPKVSSDYNCIFVEGHSRASFAVPWSFRSTPIHYLRLRYTPNAERQPYGILFVDPKTLAFEAHAGFARKPTRLSGRLDSPIVIRDWMRSQPQSAQSDSHDLDAQEIYDAIVILAQKDLEHFTRPEEVSLSHFQIGHQSIPSKAPPVWPATLVPVIGFWFGGRGKKKRQVDPVPVQAAGKAQGSVQNG